MQKIDSYKISSKRHHNPPRYYNSVTSLKFEHKPKYHLSKITHIEIDLLLLLLLPRGQNPLSYHILYNESKHNNPCLDSRQDQKPLTLLPSVQFVSLSKFVEMVLFFKGSTGLP